MGKETKAKPAPPIDEARTRRAYAIDEAKKQSLIAFKLTQEALRTALKQREEINSEINRLQKDLVKLAPFCGIENTDPITLMGLTDALRHLIGMAFMPITTDQIKDALVEARVRLPESNPLAAIQTALRRLVDSGEIESGEYGWEWISKVSPPMPPIPEWMIIENPEKEKPALRPLNLGQFLSQFFTAINGEFKFG